MRAHPSIHMKQSLSLLALVAAAISSAAPFQITQTISAQSGFTGYLEFQLAGQEAVGNGNSNVTIRNLSIVGGSLTGANLTDFGAVSGTDNEFTLSDSDPLGFADRALGFSISSDAATLSFQLDFTTDGLDPDDYFYYGVLYDNQFPIATADPGAGRASLDLYLANGNPSGYESVDPVGFETPGIAPVPEPAAFLPLSLGALAVLRRRTRR